MKVWFVVSVLLCSCGLRRDEVRAFIPGIYVSAWSSEFADTHDTLIVSLRGGELYAIERRSLHVYKGSQVKRAPQHKVDHWTATYGEWDHAMVVQQNGRVLSVDPGSRSLQMGVTVYTKL